MFYLTEFLGEDSLAIGDDLWAMGDDYSSGRISIVPKVPGVCLEPGIKAVN